ncbi:cbb3-type cytochrome oxidase assembly protein CcoS [Aequorivita marisscotiae]|jgi:cbb3-type cytochrome oxidase maturation protein|uniref:Cbb3-type cytochrome oxidase assembly protein CcoS n=1 Tax=Aequorivita marisscotiae TaxID=3040348 RepID=A0ABY8KU05_9FLAO|nr:cbb3-type cytochrome oxidase assembly protein CcoS [Aequorivita sp. Ant34-E75]WGF91645.1 cbb3-type cytochrome oxidase assembly protein CcoS [Aequorivita sp. Ant34-E75]
MTIIYMLLTISLFVAIVFFALFVFSVKKGQYDDTYTPAVRMLFEDELVKEGKQPKNEGLKNKPSEKNEITNPDK